MYTQLHTHTFVCRLRVVASPYHPFGYARVQVVFTFIAACDDQAGAVSSFDRDLSDLTITLNSSIHQSFHAFLKDLGFQFHLLEIVSE